MLLPRFSYIYWLIHFNNISYDTNNVIITIWQHIENPSIIRTVHLWYSGTFRNIQPCSGILRHIQALTCRVISVISVCCMICIQNPACYYKFRHRHIQAYCVLCSILCNSCLFRTLSYSKPKVYSELFQGIFWHILNAV